MEALNPFKNVAVLCDLDGSLVETPEHKPNGSIDARIQAIHKFNKQRPGKPPIDPDDFWNDRWLYTTDGDRLENTYPFLSYEERVDLIDLAQAQFKNDSVPIRGALLGLTSIVRQGAQCFLWTGNPSFIARTKAKPFVDQKLINLHFVFGADFPIDEFRSSPSSRELPTKHQLLAIASRILQQDRTIVYDDNMSGWAAFNSAPNSDIRLAIKRTNQIGGFGYGHMWSECDMIGDPLFRLLALDSATHFPQLSESQLHDFLVWFDLYTPPNSQIKRPRGHFKNKLLNLIAFQIFDSAYWPIMRHSKQESELELDFYKIRILGSIKASYFRRTNWLHNYQDLPLVQKFVNYYNAFSDLDINL